MINTSTVTAKIVNLILLYLHLKAIVHMIIISLQILKTFYFVIQS